MQIVPTILVSLVICTSPSSHIHEADCFEVQVQTSEYKRGLIRTMREKVCNKIARETERDLNIWHELHAEVRIVSCTREFRL